MNIKQLLETYETSFSSNKYYEGHVYVNPSPKEMMKAAKESFLMKTKLNTPPELRYFVDKKNKKLYVWNPNFLHDLFFKLNINTKKENGFGGIAKFKNKKWVHFINIKHKDNINREIKNYDWANKYILFY